MLILIFWPQRVCSVTLDSSFVLCSLFHYSLLYAHKPVRISQHLQNIFTLIASINNVAALESFFKYSFIKNNIYL